MSWKICGYHKAEKRQLIVLALDFAIKTVLTTAAVLALLWVCGFTVNAVAGLMGV